MKFKCLVLDHDDTVVNSTATIHYPCFVEYLAERKPHLSGKFDLDTFFRKNFDPGVLEFFANDVGLTEREMEEEECYWRDFVKNHVPAVYPGMREIMERFLAEMQAENCGTKSAENTSTSTRLLPGVSKLWI